MSKDKQAAPPEAEPSKLEKPGSDVLIRLSFPHISDETRWEYCEPGRWREIYRDKKGNDHQVEASTMLGVLRNITDNLIVKSSGKNGPSVNQIADEIVSRTGARIDHQKGA